MGYQASLDGVRALSVIGVILYHAGFGWMPGGFFGVEVFFVVSGFLITSLLIEERDRSGRIGLRQFWRRRWRRLLPALFTMLLAVGVWAALWGTSEQHTQLRREYPWSIFYMANWGQIFGQVPYFSGSPTLLRHLWSLAVEEQWYLVWPVVFILITRAPGRERDGRRGVVLVLLAVALMVGTAIADAAGWPARWFRPFPFELQSVNTTNFLYLSTISRSSGLLLGAGMAFLWRPWRVPHTPREGRSLVDGVALAAVTMLAITFTIGDVAGGATFTWMLPAVTLASAALVAAVLHPSSIVARPLFEMRPLVAIGKRSYGLYLWSWPISRIFGAYQGSWPRFMLAMAVTAPVNEVCYRFVETPIRSGAIARWSQRQRDRRANLTVAGFATSALVLGVPLLVFFAAADPVFDPAKDSSADVVFDLGKIGDAAAADVSASSPDQGGSSTPPTTGERPTTGARLPRRLVIVGDSTAHSLAINLPSGISETFTVSDGSVEGCSVYDSGTAISARPFTRSFGECGGWQQRWVQAAQQADAELALVVIGAWDVFDVEVDGQRLQFGTGENDQRFTAGVQSGIDALAAVGVKVALLEVPCMRPQDVKGAGVPALAERGDDARVAHVNDLLRRVASTNAATTTFIAGPREYCADEAVAADLGYRWDGVHPYKPGAKLMLEAIAASLLAVPVP